MIDNLIAFRVLYMLVTPFKDTNAFKLGIIDENGKLLKKIETMKASEKDAYNMLTRLVFNLKRLLSKLPGGETKLANLAAAYFLVMENINNEEIDEVHLEEQLYSICELNMVLVEEYLTVLNFVSLFEDAPANSTGPAVSSDEPVIKGRRRIHKFTKSQLKGVAV